MHLSYTDMCILEICEASIYNPEISNFMETHTIDEMKALISECDQNFKIILEQESYENLYENDQQPDAKEKYINYLREINGNIDGNLNVIERAEANKSYADTAKKKLSVIKAKLLKMKEEIVNSYIKNGKLLLFFKIFFSVVRYALSLGALVSLVFGITFITAGILALAGSAAAIYGLGATFGFLGDVVARGGLAGFAAGGARTIMVVKGIGAVKQRQLYKVDNIILDTAAGLTSLNIKILNWTKNVLYKTFALPKDQVNKTALQSNMNYGNSMIKNAVQETKTKIDKIKTIDKQKQDN